MKWGTSPHRECCLRSSMSQEASPRHHSASLLHVVNIAAGERKPRHRNAYNAQRAAAAPWGCGVIFSSQTCIEILVVGVGLSRIDHQRFEAQRKTLALVVHAE